MLSIACNLYTPRYASIRVTDASISQHRTRMLPDKINGFRGYNRPAHTHTITHHAQMRRRQWRHLTPVSQLANGCLVNYTDWVSYCCRRIYRYARATRFKPWNEDRHSNCTFYGYNMVQNRYKKIDSHFHNLFI